MALQHVVRPLSQRSFRAYRSARRRVVRATSANSRSAAIVRNILPHPGLHLGWQSERYHLNPSSLAATDRKQPFPNYDRGSGWRQRDLADRIE